MKRLSIFILLAALLGLLCACGEKTEVCEHVPGPEATCTEDQVCTKCGEVLTPALGHEEVLDDCEAGPHCARCGASLGAGTAHTPGPDATCQAPQTCTVCGKVLSEPTDHIPSGEASCTEDVVCTVCGEVLIAAAHEPGPEPTCIDEQVCLRCGAVLQPALGHEAAPVTAELAPTVCARCGVTMELPDNSDPTAYIDETVTGAHYHNTLDAYYSGNVLVCGDYALEYFSMDTAGSSAWAEAVNGFASRFPDLHVSALLVPKSCAYNAPSGYTNQADNQTAFINGTYAQLLGGITAVDAVSLMNEHSGEYLYYRTDHHWTSLGAYYASVAYCRANGITPRQLGSYETTVQTGYVGSLYSFCAAPPDCLKTNPDYTVCHLPLSDYTMTYANGGDSISGAALNTETNAYASAFLGGDNALTDIVTGNATGRKLLIFKESYGNAFVPYMIDYYDEIVVLDIRSGIYSTASVVEQYGITDALIINNVQASTSLVTDLAAQLAS